VEVKMVTVKPVEGDPKARAAVETTVAGKLTLVFECGICDNKASVPGVNDPKAMPPGQEPAAPVPTPVPQGRRAKVRQVPSRDPKQFRSRSWCGSQPLMLPRCRAC
jgi:hypothetical protein